MRVLGEESAVSLLPELVSSLFREPTRQVMRAGFASLATRVVEILRELGSEEGLEDVDAMEDGNMTKDRNTNKDTATITKDTDNITKDVNSNITKDVNSNITKDMNSNITKDNTITITKDNTITLPNTTKTTTPNTITDINTITDTTLHTLQVRLATPLRQLREDLADLQQGEKYLFLPPLP